MTPTAKEAVDAAVDGEAPSNNTVCLNSQADGASESVDERSGMDAYDGEAAEREASESGASETGADAINEAFSPDTRWRNVGEATPHASEGEEEDGSTGEDHPGYNRDGYDGDMASTGWETITETTRSGEEPGAKQPQAAQEPVANGGAAVVSILNGLTTSVSVEAELQCTLCHEVLCKPVTTPCGHSFCRVCLVEFLLSREVNETQCPICRNLVLPKSIHEGEVDAPVFSINVTLWNVIQLLVPAMREREAKEEDDDYAHKYDQFDAKWRMAALQQAAIRDQTLPRSRRHWAHEDDETDDSEDDEMRLERNEEMDAHLSDDDDADLIPRRRHDRYPELRRENTVDGHLQIQRNVVQDREDVNADGYHSMRVGMAIMEFPSVFQLYNEHQECSIAVLKMEEDEDLDGGFPFFTSDDGDDDALIISDYYNQIRLRVLDGAGNVVMERVRGANQGIVAFPALRLDVPGGLYHFQFTDDLYELCLMITTNLREPGEENDDSLGEDDGDRRRAGFVLDQAGERGRGRRGRRRDQSEDEDEDDESDSDDSFIVADDEDVGPFGAGDGHFSGSEGGSEGVWADSDEDEEDALERLELRRSQRQQQLRGEHLEEDDPDNDYDEEGDGVEDEFSQDQVVDGDPFEEDVNRGRSQSDPEPEEHSAPATSRLSRKRARIVDDDSESDGAGQELSAEESVDGGDGEAANQESPMVDERVGGMKRSRAIYESEDDDRDGDEESKNSSESAPAHRGFTSSKRLRQLSSRMFHDEDDEDDEDEDDAGADEQDASEGVDGDSDGDDTQAMQPGWVGTDPYEAGQSNADGVAGEDEDASDASENEFAVRGAGRVQPSEAYFDNDVDQDHSDASEGSDADHWDEGDVVEDDELGEDVEEFSD